MSQSPWILLSEEPVLQGWTRVVRQTYLMPDGRESDWDIVAGDRSVAVVAMTQDGYFLTVRQFRPGPGQVLDELPGGYVDPGEQVEQAAARELLEETGYEAGSIEIVGSSWVSAKSQLHQFCALARDCRYSRPAQSDAEEFAEVRLVDLATLLSVVRSGGLTDQGLAYRALDHLGFLEAGAADAHASAYDAAAECADRSASAAVQGAGEPHGQDAAAFGRRVIDRALGEPQGNASAIAIDPDAESFAVTPVARPTAT